jgi:peptidoglycan/xylan/chitin deacetylase (PgdA/CDA1 family)
VVIPRALQILREPATFFVVGQDAAQPSNRPLLAAIADAGHELGNHSCSHEPWRLDDTEIIRAEEAIQQATGRKPVGFRGAGHALTNGALELLVRRGYEYDASTWPTFYMPVARFVYFRSQRFTAEQRRQRRHLGARARDGFRPLHPYWWDTPAGRLLEIPVTTLPLLRTPIHLSYLFALAVQSPTAALAYFRGALWLCRRCGVSPSLLLHPTDLLGVEDGFELPYIPGMNLPLPAKIEFTTRVLDALRESFAVATLQAHARQLAGGNGLRVIKPNLENIE